MKKIIFIAISWLSFYSVNAQSKEVQSLAATLQQFHHAMITADPILLNQLTALVQHPVLRKLMKHFITPRQTLAARQKR